MGGRDSYVDTPKLFHGVERDDLFEEVVPIVILGHVSIQQLNTIVRHTFPLGGFVNHRVHSCINGCLTLKLSLS